MADALNRQNVQQVFRTIVSNKAPPDNYLLDGEISIEQNDPMRIWIGVPQILDNSGKKLLYDAGAQGEAPADGQIYGRQGSTRSWQPALAVSGGILTGPLYLQGDPTAPLMAATKQYVDYQTSIAGVGKFLPLSGGTMTGPLELATDPVNPMDAVTLQFLRANQLSTVYTADTPPAGALKNTLWWDSSGTGLYVLYDDGTSMQWVVANNQNTLFDAPSDGFSYGRMNSQWVRTAIVDAPIDGQTYGRRGSDGTWQPVLTLADVPSGANVSVSDTAPLAPNNGDLWFDSVSAQLFLFFDDGTSSAWVVAVNEPEGGLGDAPYDGKIYGRKNNLWQSTVPEAPTDGQIYGRHGGSSTWQRTVGQQTSQTARFVIDSSNPIYYGPVLTGYMTPPDLACSHYFVIAPRGLTTPTGGWGTSYYQGGIIVLNDLDLTNDDQSSTVSAGAGSVQIIAFTPTKAQNWHFAADAGLYLPQGWSISLPPTSDTTAPNTHIMRSFKDGSFSVANPSSQCGLWSYWPEGTDESQCHTYMSGRLVVSTSGGAQAGPYNGLPLIAMVAAGGYCQFQYNVAGQSQWNVGEEPGSNFVFWNSARGTVLTISGADGGTSCDAMEYGAGSAYKHYVEGGTSNRMTTFNTGGNYDYWQISTGNRCHVGYNGTVGVYTVDNSGTLTIAGAGYKPGGGSWADSSDIRIKNVLGDYTTGLDAILALNPIRYTLKGNWRRRYRALDRDAEPVVDDFLAHVSPARDGTEFVGLIANEAEKVMPEMVSRQLAVIDGEAVDDLLTLDASALPYAIVNAIKELAKRVAHLEDVVS